MNQLVTTIQWEVTLLTHSEPPKSILLLPLFIAEPKPLSFELILKKAALFDETASDGLLMAVTPAGQGNYQEVGTVA